MESYTSDRNTFNPDALLFDDLEPQPSSQPQPASQPTPQPAKRVRRTKQAPQPQAQEATAAQAAPAAKPKAKKKAKGSDRRIPIFLGVVLGLAVLYMLVVGISYFATVVNDQALVMSNTLPELVVKSNEVANTGGPLGAWLSQTLISGWMGVGIFVLIAWLGVCALRLLGVTRTSIWRATFRCFFATIALSVIVGFFTFTFSSPVYWGGEHGHVLIAEIEKIAGWPGALGATVVMIALLMVTFFPFIRALFRRISLFTVRMRRQRAARRAEAMRLKQEQEAAEAEAIRAEARAEMGENPQEEEEESEPEEAEKVELVEINHIPTIGGMEINIPKIELADVEEDNSNDEESEEDEPEEEQPETMEPYDPHADLSYYQPPTLDLLREPAANAVPVTSVEEQEDNKRRITETLLSFKVPIRSIKATVGPTVTLYEIVPGEGITISKIKRLEDDIALSLAALGIRIIAPIPGKGTVGIEVPNLHPRMVNIRSILASKIYQESRLELPMAMGCTISNEVFMVDLAKMPHVLVAGATGQGKSVGLNTIIASLLYKKHPSELKFVFVDPKCVELSLYAGIERHFLAKLPDEPNPIITKPEKVVATLNSLCLEMDNRYEMLTMAGVRGIKDYNRKFMERRLNPEDGHRYLPYIVAVVDEFGDLMLTIGKEVEAPISRIAAKARAVGIHMILATQRPSTNVITGVIKANFPGRVAFRVNQRVDSATIIDRNGANQLVGNGDMLFSNNGVIERVQCAYIDTQEVEAVCGWIKRQQAYPTAYELPEFVPEDSAVAISNVGDRDALFEEVARYVVTGTTTSTSLVQRKFNVGHNRAGRIIDQFEAAGIVGPPNGAKPRSVLMDPISLEAYLATK